MDKTPRYVTTPIYYLNDKPHLGHAYTTIAADFLVRFWRLEGRPAHFLTGTDEHGQKIAQAAEAKNRTPKEHVDRMVAAFQDMNTCINATPDDFIRTTEGRHTKGAQALWEKLQKAGHIYKGVYAGWYATRDEAYYKEEDIQDGKAPTGAPVTWVEEPCYFFRLSAFKERLLAFYKEHPDFIAPQSRYNETKRWVEGDLQDLAISRSSFTWGVPVPNDTEHVMYVWIEALSNYINGLGYPDTNAKLFKTFWPHACHLIGKDILRFHAIYWPAFLMAADLPLPQRLFVHGWWTIEGEKMSKSLGNVVDPKAMIDTYGCDTFRYFLLRGVTFGQDGDFSEGRFKTLSNADLANDLGNLSQRVLAFIQKYDSGCIPDAGTPLAIAQDLINWQANLRTELSRHVDTQAISLYLTHLWHGISLANQLMDTLKPWVLIKSEDPQDRKTLAQGLTHLLTALRDVALYVQPVMPETAEKLFHMLGAPHASYPLDTPPELTPGIKLPKPTALFPRIES